MPAGTGPVPAEVAPTPPRTQRARRGGRRTPRLVAVQRGRWPAPAGSSMAAPTAYLGPCDRGAGLKWGTGEPFLLASGPWALGADARASAQPCSSGVNGRCGYTGTGRTVDSPSPMVPACLHADADAAPGWSVIGGRASYEPACCTASDVRSVSIRPQGVAHRAHTAQLKP